MRVEALLTLCVSKMEKSNDPFAMCRRAGKLQGLGRVNSAEIQLFTWACTTENRRQMNPLYLSFLLPCLNE